ncbi:MAG: site-specific integrase [Gammaproteobacteria bacterium]|nr:site-specific integrase [Gammaproteobacteria bacterium]
MKPAGGPTVAELCARYLAEYVPVHCRPSTAAAARSVVETEDGASASAVAAIRFLALTGYRRSEILKLDWEHVALEAGEFRLPDSKTKARMLPLPPQAVELLTSLPRIPGNPWVIPGRKPGTHLRNIDEAWRAIRERAGLGSVRIHDLRHSYASRALALGESLPVIGKLLGHGQLETTARYAHLARDSARGGSGTGPWSRNRSRTEMTMSSRGRRLATASPPRCSRPPLSGRFRQPVSPGSASRDRSGFRPRIHRAS